MAKFSVTMHYETSKVAIVKGEPFEIAVDHDPEGSILGVVVRLVKEALEQGALDAMCPITIDVKRLL